MIPVLEMTNTDHKKLVDTLTTLASYVSAGAETPAESDKFVEALETLFGLEPLQEQAVLTEVFAKLSFSGNEGTLGWLMDVLDDESEIVLAKSDPKGKTSSILFAIPICLQAGDVVHKYVQRQDAFESLISMLHECDIVDRCADVGLVPRLFTHSELSSLSYGDRLRLNEYLAAQVRIRPGTVTSPAIAGADDEKPEFSNPYVQLVYLVGVAVAKQSDLSEVFPALPMPVEFLGSDSSEDDEGNEEGNEEQEAPVERQTSNVDSEHMAEVMEEGGVQSWGLSKTGELTLVEPSAVELALEMAPWQLILLRAYDDAFGSLLGSLCLGAPNGLGGDLKTGMEQTREAAFVQLFRLSQEPYENLFVRVTPLNTQVLEELVEVSCVVRGQKDPVDSMVWPVLRHESAETAMEALQDCVDLQGLELEEPLTQPFEMYKNYLLN
ncbi:hypothetical protein LC612_41120 [Nostoc sp. CHAB 5834]|nr:hypothetical protein [Nostoc sp. CHAB 5834]